MSTQLQQGLDACTQETASLLAKQAESIKQAISESPLKSATIVFTHKLDLSGDSFDLSVGLAVKPVTRQYRAKTKRHGEDPNSPELEFNPNNTPANDKPETTKATESDPEPDEDAEKVEDKPAPAAKEEPAAPKPKKLGRKPKEAATPTPPPAPPAPPTDDDDPLG